MDGVSADNEAIELFACHARGTSARLKVECEAGKGDKGSVTAAAGTAQVGQQMVAREPYRAAITIRGHSCSSPPAHRSTSRSQCTHPTVGHSRRVRAIVGLEEFLEEAILVA